MVMEPAALVSSGWEVIKALDWRPGNGMLSG
jgi:hypothetical protein